MINGEFHAGDMLYIINAAFILSEPTEAVPKSIAFHY